MKRALRKHLSIGEIETDIEIDRRLLCDVMSKYNDFFTKLFEVENEKKNLKDNGQSEEQATENVLALFNSKYPEIYLCYDEYQEEVARFALPKIIHRADEEITAAQAQTKADDIFKFAEDNEATDTLASLIVEFVFEGFTLVENAKESKVQITIA